MKMTFGFGLLDMSDMTARGEEKTLTLLQPLVGTSDDVQQQADSGSSQAKPRSVVHTQLPT